MLEQRKHSPATKEFWSNSVFLLWWMLLKIPFLPIHLPPNPQPLWSLPTLTTLKISFPLLAIVSLAPFLLFLDQIFHYFSHFWFTKINYARVLGNLLPPCNSLSTHWNSGPLLLLALRVYPSPKQQLCTGHWKDASQKKKEKKTLSSRKPDRSAVGREKKRSWKFPYVCHFDSLTFICIFNPSTSLKCHGFGGLFCNNRKPRMKFDEESDLKLYIDIGR